MSALDHPRYEARELLGSGAQGVVVRVLDREAPKRELVAKVWKAGVFSERLLEGEFALLSRLRIPGLVRAHDLARDARTGAPFLVEDYVRGPDARQWLTAASGRERSDRFVRLLCDVAETLAALHDSGFVHGDLKPAHVRVPEAGRSMLLDLGAAVARARHDDSGAVAITPGYVSPELAAGARPSARSDLYALGKLAWSVAAGELPRSAAESLRDIAAWVLPGVEDLIASLLAEHPEDRPASARIVLQRLAAALPPGALAERDALRVEAAGRTLRTEELRRLAVPRAGVRWVSGAAGSGKSHLVRELVTQALLCGREARLIRFPCDDPELVLRLVAYLRGAEAARPFDVAERGPMLVALDELELAPEELLGALEAYRCRREARLDLVAAVRNAPGGAPAVSLDPIDAERARALCVELGESDEERIVEIARASGGSPGWIAATLTGVPLTREAALERVASLSETARRLLAWLAVAGGPLSEEICRAIGPDAGAALSELSAARLVTRRADDAMILYDLAEPALRVDLAEALGSFEIVDALADVLLDRDVGARAFTLLAVARASNPPARRAELLRRAAHKAHAEGLRSEETESLLALAADPRERTSQILIELDRVTRGGGSAGLHPEIVGWLADAAERDGALAVLALRRRAEQAARSGETVQAEELARRAAEAAESLADPASIALAQSTLGAIALYRADWSRAEEALSRAHATMASGAVDDAEEVARLFHNRGVVALYAARLDDAREAFERSLEQKRKLGDRAGVWACLLNLGLALAQARRYDEAEAALEESLALTRSLMQRSGGGWCLAALADVAVRRGDAALAERRVAEAEHLGDELPAAVRADLVILRAEIALVEGDGNAALAALDRLDAESRSEDALIDVRATVVEARAELARLPADTKRAARLAIRAIRRARSAGLPEPEARARDVLAAARGRTNTRTAANPASAGYDDDMTPPEVWRWLEQVGGGASIPAAATSLARVVLGASGAERVFVALCGSGGKVERAFGVDLDGLEIGDAEKRIAQDTLAAALHRREPVYQRELDSAGGRGCRLAVASGEHGSEHRAVIVAEHRFVAARFDAVRAEDAQRWALLASIVGRLGAGVSAEPTAALIEPSISARSVSLSAEPSTALPSRVRRRHFAEIVGKSPAIERALARLEAAVDSELPVLIVGETGVGKELFARALHEHGARCRAPFVAVSCGAIPDSLFEAELYGHVRGSFTGADRARPGLLARAEGGTLFLDEIGELPLPRQATLLRALATRSYRPVGSDEEKRFDVRIVAATNRELERAVRDGSFRQDLLYRLNVLEIQVPPLREREGDVLAIARHVLAREGSRAELSAEAANLLEEHDWPGNVRELEHQMQRLAALGVPVIAVEHLSRAVRGAAGRPRRRSSGRKRPVERRELSPDRERAEVLSALDATHGNITRAADELGLTRQGLKKKMVRLGLREPVHALASTRKLGEGKA